MKSPDTLRPGERGFAALLLVAAVFAFREAYLISGFAGLTTGGVLPMLASGVMVICGLVILGETFGRSAEARRSVREVVAYLFPLRLVWFTALLIAYGASIHKIGFLAASGAFLFLGIALLWRRGPLLAAGISAMSILCIYGIFRLVFQVVLPQGTLWQ